MKYALFILSFYLLLCIRTSAQTIVPLTHRDGISIRGLSILDNKNAWVSGSKGTIGQTDDGGQTWNWFQIAHYENRDFRDIELIDPNTAIVMAVDTPAIILRTTDKGLHWEKVLEDKRLGMFLDAIDFQAKKAIVIGDPVNGRLYLATSTDAGKRWIPVKDAPLSPSGCFASSGTNIIVGRRKDYIAVTGGKTSILYWNKLAFVLPVTQGKETTGANSIALNPHPDKIAAVIVGGDFSHKESQDSNCVLVPKKFFRTPNINLFEHPIQGPAGYKSCVTYLTSHTLIATGTSGTDISDDEGYHWIHFSDIPFHVVQKAKKGNLVLLAGPNGSIARLER